MRKTILTVMIIVSGLSTYGQSDNDYLEIARDLLKSEKKAIITEVMQLTDAESGPFWTLYNEYQGKLYTIQNKRIAIIKDYAVNFESMTDQKADELWVGTMKYQKELQKLKETYYKKFKSILPAAKAAKLFQLENKIETLINYELVEEIPLIETN